jgi:hypothetical protein
MAPEKKQKGPNRNIQRSNPDACNIVTIVWDSPRPGRPFSISIGSY